MNKNNYTNKDLNILPKRLGHLTFLEKINIKQNEWRYKVNVIVDMNLLQVKRYYNLNIWHAALAQ